jgi:death-on-curing family protein
MVNLDDITSNEINKIHKVMIETYGGLPGEVRPGGVDSVLNSIYYHEGGLAEKAAYLLSRLAKGHIFNDANKRTAYFATLYLVQLNDSDFKGINIKEISQEMNKIASLPIDDSYKYALKLCKRDIIPAQPITNYETFYRANLKPIEIAEKLSKQ